MFKDSPVCSLRAGPRRRRRHPRRDPDAVAPVNPRIETKEPRMNKPTRLKPRIRLLFSYLLHRSAGTAVLRRARAMGVDRQPSRSTRTSHRDAPAERQGTRRGRVRCIPCLRAQRRRTLRSHHGAVDGHGQPPQRKVFPLSDLASEWQGAGRRRSRSRQRIPRRAQSSTTRRAAPGRPPAAWRSNTPNTRPPSCLTAACWWPEALTAANPASTELYDPASGHWTTTGSLLTARGTPHGDFASEWQGARRWRSEQRRRPRKRRTLRPGERHLDSHRQPQHGTQSTRPHYCRTARCSSPAANSNQIISQAPNYTTRRAAPGRPPAA